ncbi:hypothetical protein CLAFUW4_05368 [Fulvia fulva]|uniref:5'-3' DNA helicase ZGRF1-like N-terminal domain-containing protein n=1 Tax=Passalora fulva TaxID=5499 RepID=A0A9Q8P9U9_PASFU|nr:uncharacterized protein CLAFUR5_05516 [Fulvia fulva]KAK4624010.1 hypothetical protein CLAFUR4_05362 [Fulvia fulva]KAK4625339.1 hypothetical protein CLAFUR0_05370 [Fulvia fulva]UJO18391.1 hypothetical protein CLAFUR5_05516 [Fulvia fulva]WPV14672.1 hypothetical protein CLAFUW4_05368 [Fulvia fulva]WPV30120.1 hypothetical protein CLAFUW7_05366 [Fulvia fulva]
MTAAVFRNTPPLSVPPRQNTAPVLDFNCLYTRDVKKKAKKWQDGLLRYHTFNKRVMVYDEGRNLVGDTHWAGDEAVQEGDELRLERNGVMVQVGDNTGQTQTDLTELRKSRQKDSATVSAASLGTATSTARATPTPSGWPLSTTLSRANTQLKHRSLNALLGTPKGPIGKASLPQKSPFEERQAEAENDGWEEGRPPKRQRNTAPAWTLTRTTKTPTPASKAQEPLWARTADAAKQKKKKAPTQTGQQQLGTKEIIDLSDDAESSNKFFPGFSDEVLARSSSPPKRQESAVEVSNKIVARSSSSAFQTQQSKPSGRPPASGKQNRSAAAAPEQIAAPGTTYVRVSPEVTAKALCLESSPSSETEGRTSPKVQRAPTVASKPTSSRTGQTLRLAASAPKKRTLLCQNQLSKKPRTVASTNAEIRARSTVGDDESAQERPAASLTKLQARLARIEKKKGSTSSARLGPAKAKPAPIELDCDTDTGNGAFGDFSDDEDEEEEEVVVVVDAESPRHQTTHETSAIELRCLDSMMLPPAVPAADKEARPRAKPPAPAPTRTSAQPQERQFRRVLSEPDTGKSSRTKRVPGAPVRYTPTPSPTKRSRESTPVLPAGEESKRSVAEPAPAPGFCASRQKKPLQKFVSLNMTSNGTSKVMLSKPFQAAGKTPKARAKEPETPKDIGPWTREAFDLFTWRPPNWDEEQWCEKRPEEASNASDKQPRPPPPGLSGGAALPYTV